MSGLSKSLAPASAWWRTLPARDRSLALLAANQATTGPGQEVSGTSLTGELLMADAEALSAGAHTFEATIAPLKITGSPNELRSALGNLLSNAVRYTPAGGRITLRVFADTAQNEIAIEVKDSGVGIASEHLPRLTERFYRVDRSRSRETGGTGLGLAIVKHVAQRHRAKFEIESVVQSTSDAPHGSTFRLRFPAN